VDVLKFGEVSFGWKMDGRYMEGDDLNMYLYISLKNTIILLLTHLEG